MPGYTLDDGCTLRNKLGASNPNGLERLEEGFVAARLIELRLGLGPSGSFDAAHYRAIHRHLFQDVFEWAGHTRDERFVMEDGDTVSMPIMRRPGGIDFAVGPVISAALDALFARLAGEGMLVGLSRDAFADRAAFYFAEVNSIHPFREGNGRTQRSCFEALADAAGHGLAFGTVSRERMIVASVAAHERGDVSILQRLFREISTPSRVSALRTAQESLDRHAYDWRDRYMATTEEGRFYALQMVGQVEPNFMARDRDGTILIGLDTDLPDPVPQSQEWFEITTAEPWEDMEPKDAGPKGALGTRGRSRASWG